VFAGGVFAVANHLAGVCDLVHLVSVLGRQDTREEFIVENLKPAIDATFFYREDGPTVVKKRYINQYYNQKLFEVNYINNAFIDGDCEQEIGQYLERELPKYDMVLVSDFGHGFITNRLIELIQRSSQKIAVNTQTNAANTGYNLISRYQTPCYVCLDESELRLAAQDRFAPIEELLCHFADAMQTTCFMVTLGKHGSIAMSKDGEVNRTPIFSSKVVDTVGAGDAFFAFTAPCVARGIPLDVIAFIGNAVGALAVQIMCNKKPVEKHELLEFIHALLK
jgi:bifunctional ADP-heptose synthase (sugar kinase/adenylyltransferase)